MKLRSILHGRRRARLSHEPISRPERTRPLFYSPEAETIPPVLRGGLLSSRLVRFANCEWLQTRVGLGGNWLSDRRASEFGFNFTYKADLFLRDPLILSGELDWGTLGDETLFHPGITLGAQWHRAELFLGCDCFDIGPSQVTSLIAGGRIWY